MFSTLNKCTLHMCKIRQEELSSSIGKTVSEPGLLGRLWKRITDAVKEAGDRLIERRQGRLETSHNVVTHKG